MVKKLLFVMAAILVITFVGSAADATGKWVAQVAGRNGATQEVTFNLKVDGGSLTGTVTGGGGGGRRGGGAAAPQPREISDAKIDGDKISFSVKAEFNGQTRVTSYSGIVEGDTLKLKQTRQGRNGARGLAATHRA